MREGGRQVRLRRQGRKAAADCESGLRGSEEASRRPGDAHRRTQRRHDHDHEDRARADEVMSRAAILLAALACAAVATIVPAADALLAAQGPLAFRESENHPAIAYSTAPLNDAVSRLNRRIATGAAQLAFDPVKGYLPSVLQALQVPKESQIAVFSATSFQADKINFQNPRAIFFNDSVAVGWVRGGLLEVAAQDPRLGPVFYTLEQPPTGSAGPSGRPQFKRSAECLECHRSWETLAVPGLMVLSTFPPTTRNGY